MKLYEILASKGAAVFSIHPEATLADMVDELVRRNCGSLIVLDGDGKMVGIITERDILKSYALTRKALSELQVFEFMSVDVFTGSPEDDVADTMGLMTRERVRHLPILEEGELVGVISIGDVVKAQHAQLSVENHFMKSYIQG